MSSKIKVRFAPSPTGFLHIGSVRTALFNYLFARNLGGEFLLRIEDTDKQRSTKAFEDNIIAGLKWLGFHWDNEVIYRQSERTSLYKEKIEKLIQDGHAYISKEKPEKEGDREEVIRFRNPGSKITFTDLVHGEISFDTKELGDFVIAKSLEEPVFHLTNVVDDIEMGITHIIRGEDHISNTPRQILIWEAFGAPRAIYGHIPLILATDRSKLSKRHGAVSTTEYKERGYLPSALINFLALLGWNPGNDQEIMSMDELIKAFDINKVQKGGAIFNEEKLKWFNKEYIKKLKPEELQTEVANFIPSDILEQINKVGLSIPSIIPILLDRISIFSELRNSLQNGDWNYLWSRPSIKGSLLLWKDETDLKKTIERLKKINSLLKEIDEKEFNKENIKNKLWPYAESEGKGQVLWPFRTALTGKEKSPDPFIVAELLGKKETLERLEVNYLDKLLLV